MRSSGTVRRVHLTAPGVEETEVVEAVSTVGARIVLQDELGSVSVVGSGIDRRPDVTARALLALEGEGIDPQLVTSTPSGVTFHVAGRAVHRAVRRLHAVFGLHRAASVAPGLDRVARSVS